MNEHDSEVLAGLLHDMDYKPASDRNEAQLVILNTCSVRENADKRFFGTLGLTQIGRASCRERV